MPCVSRIDESSGSAAKMEADQPPAPLPPVAAQPDPPAARSSSASPPYPPESAPSTLTHNPVGSPDAEQNPAKKPPRKRKRKPRPPPSQPGLRWLNSTDPSQFRDDRVRKAVRSHVMYDHAARKKSLTTVHQDQFTVVHLYKDSQNPKPPSSAHHHPNVPEKSLVPAQVPVNPGSTTMPGQHSWDKEDENHLALTLLDRLASHLDPLGQLPGFAAPKQNVRELQKFCKRQHSLPMRRHQCVLLTTLQASSILQQPSTVLLQLRTATSFLPACVWLLRVSMCSEVFHGKAPLLPPSSWRQSAC